MTRDDNVSIKNNRQEKLYIPTHACYKSECDLLQLFLSALMKPISDVKLPEMFPLTSLHLILVELR